MNGRTRWEYRIATERAELNALGEEGWEIVTVAVDGGRETFYLKRPRLSIREEITLEQRDRVLKGAERR